jgi:ribosomal protein L11 methyltransferase
MHFIQISVRCPSDFSDILIAELAELEFDSFEENKVGFNAYVEEEKMDFEATKDLFERYVTLGPISYSMQKIARENWNEEWERNYPPIVIGNQILVKTPFHQIDSAFEVTITIVPKMSFGTGHHATTSQMLQLQMEHRPAAGSYVIDAGTGTGILAIMAEKMGAEKVVGFDNDPWCIENSLENYQLNACQHCTTVLASSISAIGQRNADQVLANINKNVILKEIGLYFQYLANGGKLFMSGFYTEDVSDITEAAENLGFQLLDSRSHDNWACLLFEKP